MLHWANGAERRGVLCGADIATVNMDRKSFTFMRSFPNFIPLSAKGAQAVGAALVERLLQHADHLGREDACVGDSGRNVADLAAVKVRSRTAKREDSSEGVPLVNLHVEHLDATVGYAAVHWSRRLL